MSVVQQLEKNGSFVKLSSKGEYADYFNRLSHAFNLIHQWAQNDGENGSKDADVLAGFLKKLLSTVSILRMKHINEIEHSLRLDLNKSGFPHSKEVSSLAADLADKMARLADILPADVLKQGMLDHMLKECEQPTHLLQELSQRTFLEILHEEELLFTFTSGELTRLVSRDEVVRKYRFSWCTYDLSSNMPYVYILDFEQDASDTPLEEKGDNYLSFLTMVKSEGSRVPDVGIVAFAIDEALPTIHPKGLKRICCGPLVLKGVTYDEGELVDFITKYGSDWSFALTVEVEYIRSIKQIEKKGGSLFARSQVREVFDIPQINFDQECNERKATWIHKYLIMEHSVLQHIESESSELVQQFADHQKVVYDATGEIHGI